MGRFGVGHFCNITQTAWFLQKVALNLKAHYDKWLEEGKPDFTVEEIGML